jgi:hypothetical protein
VGKCAHPDPQLCSRTPKSLPATDPRRKEPTAPDDWERLREPGLAHVLITACDASSAYRVFDALADRFPAVDPPAWLSAPPGLAAFAVLTPIRGADGG